MMYAMSLNQYIYKQVLCLVWAEMYMFKSKLIEGSICTSKYKKEGPNHSYYECIYIYTNIINSAD